MSCLKLSDCWITVFCSIKLPTVIYYWTSAWPYFEKKTGLIPNLSGSTRKCRLNLAFYLSIYFWSKFWCDSKKLNYFSENFRMSSADSILVAAINNKIDLFEIKSLSDLEEISNGCLFTLLQSFLDHRISGKVEVSFLIEICGPIIYFWRKS